jgi:hypothetical protein
MQPSDQSKKLLTYSVCQPISQPLKSLLGVAATKASLMKTSLSGTSFPYRHFQSPHS